MDKKTIVLNYEQVKIVESENEKLRDGMTRATNAMKGIN